MPTWNYVVVHAYSRLRIIEDEPEAGPWLMAHLEQLVAQSETAGTVPWKMADAPAEFTRNQLRAIVGFELAISRLEGQVEGQPESQRA